MLQVALYEVKCIEVLTAMNVSGVLEHIDSSTVNGVHTCSSTDISRFEDKCSCSSAFPIPKNAGPEAAPLRFSMPLAAVVEAAVAAVSYTHLTLPTILLV